MINMLLALTSGETRGNYNAFINSNYWYGLGVLQDLWINNHALQYEEMNFFDNGQELLLYTNLGIYACNYIYYCDMKFITSVYSKAGLVIEYDFFNYDRPEMLCLLDLSDLIKAKPKRWMYNLGNIYNKYGIDITNKVREGIRC